MKPHQPDIDTDLKVLIDTLPPDIKHPLTQRTDTSQLLEVVMDLGREPEARFLDKSILLHSQEVTQNDLQYVIERIAPFGDDNRAGIERTLHRISALRNRYTDIVGLTLRVGRTIYGTIKIIEDLISTGRSVLLLGKPGVGKTTMLREIARVLADDAHKRVIVVDTSNEIAGDGDIPHRGIGRARRMQVTTPSLQHSVMIEAVENHMPEVIIVDEIGTALDANAARTIAERGVQLVATAHGNTLENLVANPTLSDLIGGIHTVTLGDTEAYRRRTQKTVQERTSAPTFDILVEIQGWNRVSIHPNVAETVDQFLRGFPVKTETRTIDTEGNIDTVHYGQNNRTLLKDNLNYKPNISLVSNEMPSSPDIKITRILPYGINKGKLQQSINSCLTPVDLATNINNADLLLTTKNYYRRKTQALKIAEDKGKPVYVIRRNTSQQIEQFIKAISRKETPLPRENQVNTAIEETENAVGKFQRNGTSINLNPYSSFIRRIQHQIIDDHGLESSSFGQEPNRHVIIRRKSY